MKRSIMIINDDQKFIDNAFKPKLNQWNVDHHILSNFTFGDISETNFADFSREVVQIITDHRREMEVIFLDLGLNQSDESASLGFRLSMVLREKFFEIPIIALTRFDNPDLVDEGYLYDLDMFVQKTEFGELTSNEFHGILMQTVRKRERLIERIPQLYDQFMHAIGQGQATLSAFGFTFTSPASNLENILKDIASITNTDTAMSRMTVVMFADLCNSVEIKEKQGYFEGLYLTRLHNEIITNIIASKGGKVVKYIGDCVMARFDYQDQHSLDCASINSAILINEAFREHNNEYRNDAQFNVYTKIGIAVGKVIDFYGNDPQGICVDIAARLQSLATSEQILVSNKLRSYIKQSEVSSILGQASHRSPEEYFDDPIESQLKGIAKKVKYCSVHWAD